MSETYVPTVDEAELRMYGALPADRDTSENAGFVVLARTPEADLLLWTSVYAISGRGAGQWVVPDGRIHGTLLLVVPAGDDAPMGDNHFARTGMHISQFLEPADHEIRIEADRSEWKVGGRTYTWEPPVWRIRGEHAGVDLDLTFRATGAAQWRWGPLDKIVENDSAGYEVGVAATGTITAGGRTYTITDAPGFHERPSVGESRDVVRELLGGAEFTSAQFFTDTLKVSLASHSGRGIKMGSVELGDDVHTFAPFMGSGDASFDILERWHDPRSGLSVPRTWHVACVSAAGALDVTITARARGYFHYLTAGGVMILMWILARADGTFRLADGTTHPIDNAPVGLRWGRNLLVADECLDP
ncbi:MAG: hypothetical protein AB7U39_21210 [Ilumatobacteraceae bacterium]